MLLQHVSDLAIDVFGAGERRSGAHTHIADVLEQDDIAAFQRTILGVDDGLEAQCTQGFLIDHRLGATDAPFHTREHDVISECLRLVAAVEDVGDRQSQFEAQHVIQLDSGVLAVADCVLLQNQMDVPPDLGVDIFQLHGISIA